MVMAQVLITKAKIWGFPPCTSSSELNIKGILGEYYNDLTDVEILEFYSRGKYANELRNYPNTHGNDSWIWP